MHGRRGAAAQRLRETDVVARLGGDEFAVLLPRRRREDGAATSPELARDGPRHEPSRVEGQRTRASPRAIGIALFEAPS